MDIFKYVDYRRFLADFIANKPKKGRGEINRIAKFSGVHPSLLSQILAGHKNLSLEQAQLISEYMGLAHIESEFFFNSVQFHRAGTTKLKDYFQSKMSELKNKSAELVQRVRQDQKLSEEDKATFYSHWLYLAIWLSTSIKDGKNLEEISKEFRITRDRASEILQFLIEKNICISKEGRFFMGAQSIHLERGSVHLPKHHTHWRLRAIEASDKISADEVMYTAPFSISHSDFKKMRERLTEVVKDFTEQAMASEAEDIACFNLDLFWIKKSI